MFIKDDLAHSQNLIKALGKGKFELEGLEVLALSDAMRWLSKLSQAISQNLEDQKKPAVEISNPVVTSPVQLPKRQRKVKE